MHFYLIVISSLHLVLLTPSNPFSFISSHLFYSHFPALFNRAFAYDKVGLVELAVADYTTALSLQPENAFAYYNRLEWLSRMTITSLPKLYDHHEFDICSLPLLSVAHVNLFNGSAHLTCMYLNSSQSVYFHSSALLNLFVLVSLKDIGSSLVFSFYLQINHTMLLFSLPCNPNPHSPRTVVYLIISTILY